MIKHCPHCKSINCGEGKCNDIFSAMLKIKKEAKKPFFKGYEPNFFFKIDRRASPDSNT